MIRGKEELLIKDRLKDIIIVKETKRPPRRPTARTSTQLPILSTPKIFSAPKIQDPRYKIAAQQLLCSVSHTLVG